MSPLRDCAKGSWWASPGEVPPPKRPKAKPEVQSGERGHPRAPSLRLAIFAFYLHKFAYALYSCVLWLIISFRHLCTPGKGASRDVAPSFVSRGHPEPLCPPSRKHTPPNLLPLLNPSHGLLPTAFGCNCQWGKRGLGDSTPPQLLSSPNLSRFESLMWRSNSGAFKLIPPTDRDGQGLQSHPRSRPSPTKASAGTSVSSEHLKPSSFYIWGNGGPRRGRVSAKVTVAAGEQPGELACLWTQQGWTTCPRGSRLTEQLPESE